MNALAWILFGVTAAFAVTDWWAVGTDNRQLEYTAKPLTLLALIGAAAVIDATDDTAQWFVLVALVFSLLGDIFLMLPREKLFIAGLGSFFVGHLAYIVGLRFLGFSAGGFLLAVILVAVTVPIIGSRIIAGVRDGDEPELAIPVTAYIAVISIMVVSAGATGLAIALVGALLFYVSDAVIGWTKFRRDFRGGRLAIITTYHLGQMALVASLVA